MPTVNRLFDIPPRVPLPLRPFQWAFTMTPPPGPVTYQDEWGTTHMDGMWLSIGLVAGEEARGLAEILQCPFQ